MKRMTTLIALISILILSSCTTMTFIPTEGGAAKFNLATVEYVQAQNDATKTELTENISENISAVLDSLLAADREIMDSLQTRLAELDSSIAMLEATIDTTEMNVERSLAGMSKELTTVKTNASSTRMVIRRINDSIDELPVRALETFNDAIEEYLNKDEEATE